MILPAATLPASGIEPRECGYVFGPQPLEPCEHRGERHRAVPPLLGQRGGVEAGQERMLREEHPSHPLVRAPGIAQMRYHLDGEPLAGVRALAGLLVGCSRTRARRVTSVAR